MSDELKPCNYCKDGGEPRIVSDGFFYVAGCNECGYTMSAYYTKESAIAAWNARADDKDNKPDMDMSKSVHMCPNEYSREQLEADIAKWCDNDSGEISLVKKWLDRQAAITERELCGRCSPYATAKDYMDTIDSLTAERDELRDKLDEKQHVCDVQRDSFLKLEAENAELRRMLADAAEAI